MAVNESQLDIWSAQGSVTQSAATYQSISNLLNDSGSPYYYKSFETFLHGSYGNDTNIYSDSDVDIVMRLSSVYYSDTSELSATDKANYEKGRTSAEYSLKQFKSEVTDWLRKNFGEGVKPGNKAIYVPGNNSRRDADVLACAEHRRYTSYPSIGTPTYREGIAFWTKDGTKIVNYPKQHSANCTTKHQNTGNYFKRTVRVMKNMRNRMIDERKLNSGVAPSYFIEGLLWNVPDSKFGTSYTQTISQCIKYICEADTSNFTCANDFHFLLRDNQPVCWSPTEFAAYMTALRKYWA
ncbi:MAG: nucleotidyltransferase [Pseudomonadota bacterium]